MARSRGWVISDPEITDFFQLEERIARAESEALKALEGLLQEIWRSVLASEPPVNVQREGLERQVINELRAMFSMGDLSVPLRDPVGEEVQEVLQFHSNLITWYKDALQFLFTLHEMQGDDHRHVEDSLFDLIQQGRGLPEHFEEYVIVDGPPVDSDESDADEQENQHEADLHEHFHFH